MPHRFNVLASRTFVASFWGRCATREIADMRSALRSLDVPEWAVVVEMQVGATLGHRGRKAITAMMQEASQACRAWAVMMGGDSLWASMARMIGARTMLLADLPYPAVIVQSPEEVAAFLGTRAPAFLPDDFVAWSTWGLGVREDGPTQGVSSMQQT